MAGANHIRKPPHPPPSAAPSPSVHRNKARVGSSSSSAAATPPSNQKKSSPGSGDSKKSGPSSNKNPSGNNGNTKPPTPKLRGSGGNIKPSPKPTQQSPKIEPTFSKLPPFPFLDPPPPPSYGFHMLERRTLVLADGSVRSYFALPPDYQDFPPLPSRPGPAGFGFDRTLPMSPEFGGPEFRPPMGDRGDRLVRDRSQEYWNPLGRPGHGRWVGPGEGPGSSMKRKFGDEDREGRDGFERQRQQLLQFGNSGGNVTGMPGTIGMSMGREGEEIRPGKYMRTGDRNMVGPKHNQVDQEALKKAFLHFVKLVYENPNQRRKYLADGKQGPLHCIVCGRSSKEFFDMHSLIMHVYNSDNCDLIVDHLGLHKALCILMGWNYRTVPDNMKAYQLLPADEAAANLDELILWPPLVILHNTLTGKYKDGRVEGMGNRAMDNYIRELGIGGGKSKSLYSRGGHLGITLIKFAADRSGLEEAMQLAKYFEKDDLGRKGWARVESLVLGKDEENNPNLVKVDQKTGEKKRIFYGYLANVSDIDKIDFDTKKKTMVESWREYKYPN